jgi:hypothetical protein
MTTNARRARHAGCVILGLAAASAIGTAQAALEPVPDRACGGVCANACGNQAMPM